MTNSLENKLRISGGKFVIRYSYEFRTRGTALKVVHSGQLS